MTVIYICESCDEVYEIEVKDDEKFADCIECECCGEEATYADLMNDC